MNFTHYDLKQCQKGQAVEVTLQGNAANILLLDNLNFQKYRNGKDYKYYGGHVTTSVSTFPIPHTGHWHVAIDLGGYGGSVHSSVRMV